MMMKSVALTESLFVHCEENDYVVVDVPVVARNHFMTSIYDEDHCSDADADTADEDDDHIEGKDSDDASYDYCDEFLTVDPFQTHAIGTSTVEDTAARTRHSDQVLLVVPFVANSSFKWGSSSSPPSTS